MIIQLRIINLLNGKLMKIDISMKLIYHHPTENKLKTEQNGSR